MLLQLLTGMGTTALTLTTALYHLTAQPKIWAELQANLREKFPDWKEGEPNVVELEKIPLLEACVKEALRLSVPVRGRFPRDVPKGGCNIHGFHIPEKAIVSSSSGFYCHDPSVFPEPLTFNPHRWLKSENLREMQRHLLVFSNGTRSCIGQTFAQIEIKIALSQAVLHLNAEATVDPQLGYYSYSATAPSNDARVKLRAVN